MPEVTPYPGEPVQRGDKGLPVREIQARLGVQLTGEFGPTTEACVTAFQRSRDLEPDGVVGPLTWRELFTRDPKATHNDIGRHSLAYAMSCVGEREQPLGSNRGPFVDTCNREVGVPLGSFWCMSFVQKCVADACDRLKVPVPILRTAGCSVLYRWARQHGRLVARPEPGDIFLCIGGERGHYHTGFVVELLAGERFSTIEGNSNDDGSANGVEVAYRRQGRRLSSCHYVRL